MENKKCALIRQTWYETARKRMKDGARLAFYEACFEYEFYGRLPEDAEQGELFPHDDALLLFDMVKDTLAMDMEKAETIAMRNRRNGMKGGRPPKDPSTQQHALSNPTNPNETQKNPENPSGFFGVTTTLHNTTLHNDKEKSLSMSRRKNRHADIDRYDFFRVMFVFFCNGSPDPKEETDKFYNYYGARDWKVPGGVVVRDKVKLAQTWDVKDSVPGLIGARQQYADLIRAIDPEETELLTDFVAWVRNETTKTLTIRMKGSNTLANILESKYLAGMTLYLRDVYKMPAEWSLLYAMQE